MKTSLTRAHTHVKRIAKDHFIPHEGNNHHPHVLKHRVLFGYGLFAILLKLLAISISLVVPSSNTLASAITKQNIISLTNVARAQQGLEQLTENQTLAAAANAKAVDMLTNQYFAHTSPSGLSPWYWIKKFGYTYLYSGENLAVHFTSAEDIQNGWMLSATHRANILNPRFTETGIGIAMGDFEGAPTTFVVQLFGKPIAKNTAEPTPEPQKPPTTSTVVVNEASLKVTPKKTAYAVRVNIANASSAVVQLGTNSTKLAQKDVQGEWSGDVPYDASTLNPSGETLSLVATDAKGETIQSALAILAPNANTAQTFAFNRTEPNSLKLFGFFTIQNIDDSVRKTYLFLLFFLAAALLINAFARFSRQRISVAAHTLGVIILVSTLLLT